MPQVLEFGPFTLDLDQYQLRKAGRNVRMQHVPMELLILLVERRGGLVTRERIIAQLWSSDADIDSELGVNTAIRKVRRALGDHADRPRFVETVVGKGYRFIAPIVEHPREGGVPASACEVPAGVPPPQPDIAVRKPRPRWNSLLIWLATAAVIVFALSILVTARTPRDGGTMRVAPLTAQSGLESGPSFSPDGGEVAFAWTSGDGVATSIFKKAVNSNSPARLTEGNAADSSPSWSPDGRQIAFLREDESTAISVMVVSANGGPVRRVGRLAVDTPLRAAWSPDGKALAVVDSVPPHTPPSLFLMAIETGEKRRLTTAVPSGSGDSHPAYSPDGATLAFLRNLGSIGTAVLTLMPVDRSGMARGPARQIATDRANFLEFDWSADGRSLICTTQSAMVRIPISGGRSQELPFPDAGQVSVSRHGNRMVYSHSVRDTDIFRAPGPGASGPVEKLISSTRLDGAPQFSADGTKIVFVSQRTGSDAIWVAADDGRDIRQVVSISKASLGCPRWSPDGASIAFDSTQDGRSDIYLTGSQGGKLRRLTAGGSNNVRPSWSNDGRWIYFGSDRTGAWEIWKAASRGGEPVRVTLRGGREAFEDRAGRFLYYTREKPARGIWRVPVSGGAEERTAEWGSQGRWALGERGLYFLNDRGELELSDFAGGPPAALPDTGLRLAPGSGGLLAVGPGDRWMLVTALARTGSDLTLVEGFR